WYRVHWYDRGFAPGHFRVCFSSRESGSVAALGPWISRTRMGDFPFLCAQNAGDLARAPTDAHHLRPISVFAESALSRRKRVHFFWSRAALGIANGACRDHYSHSTDGSLHSPGRKTIRASFR